VVRQTGTPSQGIERLHEREVELAIAMAQVERLLARQGSHLRIEEDRLVLSPLEANPRPASADASAERIAERLPRVELSELLMEVDTWTHFSRHFVHAADADELRPALLPQLYASLLAHACNFG
jgi:Tn3 transposase DDE domain